MTRTVESYEQAVEFLFNRVNFERLSGMQYSADDFKLDRMRDLLRRLGDPHESIPAVHIAGTKGKGSTAAYTAAILTAAGFRVGLFTSPHISAFEERMSVAGCIPAPDELVELVRHVAPVVAELDKDPGHMSPTYFEIATALAWIYFRQQGAAIAVLETGMGGRLDATNLCRPAACVITTISRDHTRQLGSRVEQIAREKAGIVKPGVPVVSGVTDGEARAVIAETCRRHNAPLFELGRDFHCRYRPATIGGQTTVEGTVDVTAPHRHWEGLRLPLVGEHQARNLALSLMAVEALAEQGWQIPAEAAAAGLATLRWPGRIEVVQRDPTVIVDTAHNWEAVAALLRTLDESFSARRRLLVFAATRDKDVAGMLRQLLPRFDTVIVTCFQNNPRQIPVDRLAETVRGLTDRMFHTVPDAASAWKLACRLATTDDLICVTGSFFLAAEVRELIAGSVPAARTSGVSATSP
ncbi:MAG: bifunctional folylpolyglutamate synthase/dihydrofolate synthase [Planctomycetia bacterium]|nr:bifunctional folylpolyglutamate synthase/dihydrofolate synthase [Planctomycetia bacterium]